MYFFSSQLKSSASYYYKTESRGRYSDFKYGQREDTINLDGVLSYNALSATWLPLIPLKCKCKKIPGGAQPHNPLHTSAAFHPTALVCPAVPPQPSITTQ